MGEIMSGLGSDRLVPSQGDCVPVQADSSSRLSVARYPEIFEHKGRGGTRSGSSRIHFVYLRVFRGEVRHYAVLRPVTKCRIKEMTANNSSR